MVLSVESTIVPEMIPMIIPTPATSVAVSEAKLREAVDAVDDVSLGVLEE